MNKTRSIIIGAVVLVLVIVGVVALARSSNSSSSSKNTSSKTGASVASNSILTTKTDPTLGQYLADPSGKPLYTYDKDSQGASNCTGSCLSNWPAYTTTSSPANPPAGVSTISRSDNHEVQYTYNGMPLYYFTGDSGNAVTGNGVEDFMVAKPVAATNSTSSGNSSTQQSSDDRSSSLYDY